MKPLNPQTLPNSPHTKDVADLAAGSAAIGAYFAWLPEVAAALAAIWTLIRSYEWSRIRIFKMPPVTHVPDVLPEERER